MSEDSLQIQMFVVDERAFACWNVDADENLAFIRNIDPQYFTVQADALEPLLQTDQQQIAATALRLAYSHALETQFAFTYAALQAPNCVQGWLLKYTVEDLHRITGKIRQGQFIHTRFPLQSVDWPSIIHALYARIEAPEVADFARWYCWFADDLLDDARRGEYNQVKHGFRTQSTPFVVSFHPDGATEPITWQSGYGMGFSEVARLVQGNQVNFQLQYRRINWTPAHMAPSIRIIVVLISNLLALLRYHLAHEDAHLLMPPDDVTIEHLLTTRTHDLSHFRETVHFDVQPSDMVSVADILASYQLPEDQR
jgi:hypothetical protein